MMRGTTRVVSIVKLVEEYSLDSSIPLWIWNIRLLLSGPYPLLAKQKNTRIEGLLPFCSSEVLRCEDILLKPMYLLKYLFKKKINKKTNLKHMDEAHMYTFISCDCASILEYA